MTSFYLLKLDARSNVVTTRLKCSQLMLKNFHLIVLTMMLKLKDLSPLLKSQSLGPLDLKIKKYSLKKQEILHKTFETRNGSSVRV